MLDSSAFILKSRTIVFLFCGIGFASLICIESIQGSYDEKGFRFYIEKIGILNLMEIIEKKKIKILDRFPFYGWLEPINV